LQFETIPNSETWLVCGGRYFKDTEFVYRTLTNLTWVRGAPLQLVQGGSDGADHWARLWASDQVVVGYTEFAKWDVYLESAGPIRNQLMLDKYKPDLVIAFPGGIGTAHMVHIAHKAGVEVIPVMYFTEF
jgi:hypothetical protein